MNVTPHNETVHRELINRIDNLLSFCKENNYSFLVLIGKDGQCSRYMEGTFEDIEGMVGAFAKDNKEFEGILTCVNQ
jgi:hypothetical protein